MATCIGFSTEGLNLVLLGKMGAGKSASGNTILGRQAFISKKSPISVTRDVTVESGTVGQIPVTVYDTPGLFDTDMSEEEILRKYEEVLQTCESGLCVFLLVIKADRFTEEERKTVEKIEELLGEKRLKKTWILFTRGDELEDENMTIKEFIDDTEPLKNLVQKYDQRYHVFNNNKRGHTEQVQMLLIKIFRQYFDILGGEVLEVLKQNPLRRKIPNYIEPAAPADSPSSRQIVLLGKNGVGKSAAGNTILGQKYFTSMMRMPSVTSECSEAHATVSGRSVSVVDTPGLFDTQMNPEEIMTEIARSVYLTSPGPHAFLIVFPVNMRFTEHELQILQMIEMLFGEGVLKYSIILFTHGDQLEEKSVEELIKENCKLRDLVQQCGGRFHVFNNEDQNNREQVNDLLQKIDTMIEQNGGGHYSNQMFEDAQRFRREEEEQRQRGEDTPVSSLSSRRIVLLGKNGVGKSAAGNTILGQKYFTSMMSMSSVTSECSEAHATVSGRSVSVVDTPGLFHTQMNPEELVTEIARSVYLSSPGPHAFLIVFAVNIRFTEQEQQILQMIEMLFGEEVLKYSIILFTHGDHLEEDESVEELIEENCKLRDLVDQCGGRFHVFNNKDQNNREQVNDLLQKIDTMIEQNGGGHYSNEMFEDALRFRREERFMPLLNIMRGITRLFTQHRSSVNAGAITGAIIAAPAIAAVGVAAAPVAAVGAAVTVAAGAVGAVYGAAIGALYGAFGGALYGAAGEAIAGRADDAQRGQRKEEKKKQKEQKK